MATSDRRGRVLPRWFGTRAHYLGSGGAAAGLVVSLVDGLGLTSAAVVGGLYAAGAVLGVAFRRKDPTPTPEPPPGPTPPPIPDPHPTSEPPPTPEPPPPPTESLRARLAGQRTRVAQARWPEQGTTLARYLLDELERWLPATAAEQPHEWPGERVEEAVAALEHYERDRSWQRLEPDGPSPEEALAERVGAVLDELGAAGRLSAPSAARRRGAGGP
ncbi:hypothetical protein OG455_29930 [Kitasatospora sp. NBC_01287]|uniref:hypothetical protein n=1 Tax=Kitasatospora sp. NBC_01287 TaxID=2903573 RepID=UPI002254C444|nr:hypothetical protein [Kitasatospora sp. NBC_01287]MCX4749684.1 hypothetical protein [Kitasatospora sp. NBC_01287]